MSSNLMMISFPRWRIYLTSLSFALAYGVPAIPLVSIWVGKMSGHPNLFAALPLIIAYVLVPIIEGLWPYGIRPIPPEQGHNPNWQLYYRFLLWLSLPIQLGMLYMALHYWSLGLLNIWGGMAYILSVGIYSGMFAITIGHELIHHPQPLDRALGGIILSTVCFGTFKIVHLRIHHRYVCTPEDFATAKKGQSIYSFWWQSIVGNVTEALRCEWDTCSRQGKGLWNSELLLWTGLSLVWFACAVKMAGWSGGLFWGLQAFIAILKLDWTNYLQHYGLTRRRDANQNYEPVQLHHAWSLGLFIHDLAIFNLLRHGDHHVNPQRLYPFLEHGDRTREYPYNYSIMYLLSLIPSVFERVVHPYLDEPEGLSQSLQEV